MINYHLQNYHVFNYKGKFFLYGIHNLVVFEVSEICYDIVNLKKPINIQNTLKTLLQKYTEEDIKTAINELVFWEILQKNNPNNVVDMNFANPYYKKDNDIFYIHGLYITISQTCNLRCKYCSAEYGKFGQDSPEVYMNDDIAKSTIDFLVKNIRQNINNPLIVFVGGEPLLNFKIIKFIVDYV